MGDWSSIWIPHINITLHLGDKVVYQHYDERSYTGTVSEIIQCRSIDLDKPKCKLCETHKYLHFSDLDRSPCMNKNLYSVVVLKEPKKETRINKVVLV